MDDPPLLALVRSLEHADDLRDDRHDLADARHGTDGDPGLPAVGLRPQLLAHVVAQLTVHIAVQASCVEQEERTERADGNATAGQRPPKRIGVPDFRTRGGGGDPDLRRRRRKTAPESVAVAVEESRDRSRSSCGSLSGPPFASAP